MNELEKLIAHILLKRAANPELSANELLNLMLAYQALVAAASERSAVEEGSELDGNFPDIRWQ
jgi:hypothetical protein